MEHFNDGAMIMSTVSAVAATINVPADYLTIQVAINAASSGDTVLVAAGTYSPSINSELFPISMKNGVSLVGAGEDVCTLDAENTNIVIYCSGINDTSTKIEGFTIINGNGSAGGGIYCNRSFPIITRNFITGNRATGYYGGGGICCYQCSPDIIFNIITGNSSHYNCAGGITCWASSPIIVNNIITENSSLGFGSGGGIHCTGGSPKIINNVISRNNSSYDGGGVFSWLSTAKITNNIITNNTAPHSGGGIWATTLSSTPTITFNDVWSNPGGNYSGCSGGTGCISVDPLYVESTVDDYHLQQSSPCIDTGDNFASGIQIYDFDGNPRILDGDGDGIDVVDMGAFEYLGVIEATININPDTLNLKRKGKWITAYLELPEGYDVADIDVSTILLNDSVPAEEKPNSVGDYDDDGIIDLMVKFNGDAVMNLLEVGEEVEITVSGELNDGPQFEGKDKIKVINKGK